MSARRKNRGRPARARRAASRDKARYDSRTTSTVLGGGPATACCGSACTRVLASFHSVESLSWGLSRAASPPSREARVQTATAAAATPVACGGGARDGRAGDEGEVLAGLCEMCEKQDGRAATEEEIKRHDIFIGNVSLSIS